MNQGKLKGRYTFCRPGSTSPFLPEGTRSGSRQDGFSLSEACVRPAWKGPSVGDIGVDVVVELSEPCFVDHVVLSLGEGAAVAEVSLLLAEEAAPGPVPLDIVAGRDGERQGGQWILSAGEIARTVVVRIRTLFRDISIEELEVWGSDSVPMDIYPTPRSSELDDSGEFVLDESSSICLGSDSTEDLRFAAEYLQELLTRRFGRDLVIDEDTGSDQAITIRSVSDAATAPREQTEDYSIDISSDGIVLYSSGRLGLLYGASALVQLFGQTAGRIAAPWCRIEDSPAHRVRGFHLGLPPREEIGFLNRLVRYLLIPYRYNTVFLEFAAGMEFSRHPEINAAWIEANDRARKGEQPPVPHGDMVAGGNVLSKVEVAGIVEHMKAHGLEVIPEVQSLSHVQYLTIPHPELAEIPAEAKTESDLDLAREDKKPVGYHHCYCPLAPGVYEILFDLIDEIVDVVSPERYVHLGHDEVYQIGTCPRCREVGKAKLFADDVLRLDGHIRSKGLRSMIWSDMLQPLREYGTEGAIGLLPRDIVMLDFVWYFYLDEDIEDELLSNGFDVIIGNLYSSHYPRFAHRIHKDGMVGGEVSTWCRIDERSLAAQGKLYDLMYTSQMLWSDEYHGNLRWTVDREVSARIPELRSDLRGRDHWRGAAERSVAPVELAAAATIDVADLDSLAFGPFEILGTVSDPPPGVVAVSSRSRRDALPPRAVIPVDSVADSLYFAHCATERCALGTVLGGYRLCYADGTVAEIPLEYGWNILEFSRRHNEPLSHSAYRHFGYTGTYTLDDLWHRRDARGKRTTVYGYQWTNPHPETRIESIRVETDDEEPGAGILLFALAVVRSEGDA